MALDADEPLTGEMLHPISDADLEELRTAVATLEQSSLASKLGAIIGRPIDFAAQLVPGPIAAVTNSATRMALRVALRMAVRSLSSKRRSGVSNRAHMAYVAVSGAAGGAFGLASLPVELPVSTTIMLRSIADIARSQGEDLSQTEARLACLEVFALGSGSETGPMGESGYLAMRALLARTVSEAARYAVQRGIADEAAPIMVKLAGQIASRFGIVVGQKAMAQTVPILGAVAGAAINAAFIDHFQNLAKAHFAVRRLERFYGEELVQATFRRLRQDLRRDAQPDEKDAADAQVVTLLPTEAVAPAAEKIDPVHE